MTAPETSFPTVVKKHVPKSTSTEIQQFIDSLPVQKRVNPVQSIKDSITQESEDLTPPGEGLIFRALLSAMTWVMFALTMGVVAWYTTLAAMNIIRP